MVRTFISAEPAHVLLYILLPFHTAPTSSGQAAGRMTGRGEMMNFA
jgi:hypothetical protein